MADIHLSRKGNGLFVMLLFAVGLFVCALCSCTATHHLNKALEKNRTFVFDTLRKLAPCITTSVDTGKVDTVTTTITKTDTVNTVRVDTLKCKDGEIVTLPCIAKTITIYRHDTTTITLPITKYIKDSADNIVKDATIKNLTTYGEKEHSKHEFWYGWAIISSILLLLAIIVIIWIVKQNKINRLTNRLTAT